MCDKCEKVIELLNKTKGLNSGDFTYVEFSFPSGEPVLMRAADIPVE